MKKLDTKQLLAVKGGDQWNSINNPTRPAGGTEDPTAPKTTDVAQGYLADCYLNG
jgi:hypothetical protein